MPRKFLPKVIPNENKEETVIRQQLSFEKFKAEIGLQKIRSQTFLERFQTLDACMISNFTMNYDNDVCNSLTELWETDCLKEQQKSIDIFDTKREWYLNNTTTEFRNNSEERKPEQKSKQNNNNNNNRRTQNSQRQNRHKNSKDRSRSKSSSQKGTNNQEAAKQHAKSDKEEECPTPAESRNQHSNKKNKHKFEKFNRPSKQQKNKTFDVVVVEPTRNEDTEERRQSQTVIVPDTQETDGDQQSNGEDANNFLFHGQGATRTNQTNRQ